MDVCPRTLTQTPAIKLCHKVKSKKHIAEKKKKNTQVNNVQNKQTNKQTKSLTRKTLPTHLKPNCFLPSWASRNTLTY